MKKQASIAEARDQLSALVNAVAHGRQRITLTSRGRPKAALVSLDDLAALEGLDTEDSSSELDFLRAADELRRKILEERQGVLMPDSSEELYAIREERS